MPPCAVSTQKRILLAPMEFCLLGEYITRSRTDDVCSWLTIPRHKAGCTHRSIHTSVSLRTSLGAYFPPINSLMLRNRKGVYRESFSAHAMFCNR